MSEHYQHGETAVAAAAKLSPAWGITGATLMGVHVQDLVLWATLIYTLLMIAERLYKWVKAWRAERDATDE